MSRKRRNVSLEVADSFFYHIATDLEAAAKFLGRGRRAMLKVRVLVALREVEAVRKWIKELKK